VKEDQGMVLILGEEIHIGKTEAGDYFHLVGLGMKEEISYVGDEVPIFKKKWWEVHPQEVIDTVKAQKGEVILAHPYWSGLTTKDMLSCQGYMGIEVFNTSCHYVYDKGYSMTNWDDILIHGRNVFGFSSDDSHNYFNDHCPIDACGAWIMVRSKKLAADEIMNSIKSGLFYASCGPEIRDLQITKDKIFVATSPVKSVSFIAANGQGEKFTALKGGTLMEVEYKIKGYERYIRIQCIDIQARMAWTNAMFFRKIA